MLKAGASWSNIQAATGLQPGDHCQTRQESRGGGLSAFSFAPGFKNDPDA